MSTVKVTAKEGQVVIPSANKPEYGYIRVESITPVFENGFVNHQKRSALIRGKVADLQALNFTEGKAIPGKIIVVETTTAPYADAQPKVNPSTGEVCKSSDGLSIYRDCYYVTDMSKQDVIVEMAKAVSNIATGA